MNSKFSKAIFLLTAALILLPLQTVYAADTTPPVVTSPADVQVAATGKLTGVAIGTATATDDSGSVASLDSDAPAEYPLGTTVVTWWAFDASGNVGFDTQNVTVKDGQAPLVKAPTDISMISKKSLTVVDLGSATASDNVELVSLNNDAPDQFPLGVTVVTWIALDSSGNVGTDTQVVEIKSSSVTVSSADTTPPVVTAPANVSKMITGTSTTVNIGTATATDNVGVVSLTNNAPSTFPVGNTVVTWVAKDAAGNIGTDTQTVTVTQGTPDTTSPVVTAPADVSVSITGTQVAVNTGSATATDNVGVVSLTSNAPALFPVGTTIVTWTAWDAAGNVGLDTQTITVTQSSSGIDTNAPEVTPPPNINVSAKGNRTTVEIGMATAFDNVGVVSLTNNAPSKFPVGISLVVWSARDAAGNVGTANQIVTVMPGQLASSDTASPVVTPPPDVTVKTSGTQTQVNTGTATATDNVAVVAIKSNAPALFPLGTTMVTWTATDSSGNTGSATQRIDVLPGTADTTPPVVTAPVDVAKTITGTSTTANIGTATATDNVGVVSLTNNAPAQFPVGTTVVTWVAKDAAGNIGTDTQNIVITQSATDTEAPVVTAPADVAKTTTGTSTTANIGTATATDNVGVVSLTNNAPTQFPVGTTVVTWTAKDAAGNTGTDTQNIVITKAADTTAPVVTAPADVAKTITGTSTTANIGTATATDNVGVVSLTNNAPALFPVGTTVVTWTAKDAAGNTGTDTQNVVITQSATDTTAPVVTAPADVAVTTTGTQTAANIGTATATDNVGVVSLTNNAPALFPVGTTVVTWTAKDAAGNIGTDTQNVLVTQSGTTPPPSGDASFVNVKDFGAVGNGSTDDTRAIQAAVDSLYNNNLGGGTVYFPPGRYRLEGTASGDTYQGRSLRNGILLRHVNASSKNPTVGGSNNRITLRGAGKSTVLYAPNDNTVAIRISTSFVTVKDMVLSGSTAQGEFGTRAIGIGIIPENMQDGNTASFTTRNLIKNVYVEFFQEGIMFMCGPSSSECSNNSISYVGVRATTRGIYLASGLNGSSGSSMNQFKGIATNWNNVGIHIESGSHNICVHCVLNNTKVAESPYAGLTPRATPTALVIDKADKWGVFSNDQNQFLSLPFEDNTMDLENGSSTTELYATGSLSKGHKMKMLEMPSALYTDGGSILGKEGLHVGPGSKDPKAIMKLDSTTQGFLPPRMSTGTRNNMGTVPEGLVIYNTSTDRLNVFDGSVWKEMKLN